MRAILSDSLNHLALISNIRKILLMLSVLSLFSFYESLSNLVFAQDNCRNKLESILEGTKERKLHNNFVLLFDQNDCNLNFSFDFSNYFVLREGNLIVEKFTQDYYNFGPYMYNNFKIYNDNNVYRVSYSVSDRINRIDYIDQIYISIGYEYFGREPHGIIMNVFEPRRPLFWRKNVLLIPIESYSNQCALLQQQTKRSITGCNKD